MNDSTRVRRRPRRAGPATARTAAAIIATAALALLAAACSSGSPSSAGSGGSPNAGETANSRSTNSQALAFGHCMRSQGVPNYPDPNSSRSTGCPKSAAQQLGVSSSQFQAAQRACQHLLPNGGQAPQSASQQLLSDGLKFARCMRSHGVPNWPDPTRSTPAAVALGAPPYMFQMDGLQGLDGRSFPPQVRTAMHECLHLTHLTGSQVPDWSG